MSKSIWNIVSIMLAVAAGILFCEGMITEDIGAMSLAVFLAWGAVFLRAMSVRKRNSILIFFLLSFFVFLLSRVMVRWIQNQEIYQPFNKEIMMMIYGCLMASLAGLWLGANQRYSFTIASYGSRTASNTGNDSKIDLRLIRLIAIVFTIVSGFASMAVVLEQVVFWGISGSGGDLRVAFESTLPSFILRLSYIYVLMLSIYLATMPSKRGATLVFLQYLICSALKMVYGSRSDFVLGLMFIVVYFRIRDRLNDSNGVQWFGKKELLFTITSIPLLVVLVVFVGYYRTHTTFEFSGMYDTLLDFFESQGGSIDVIGYTKIHGNKLEQPHFLYMFDKTYEFLSTNPLVRLFTGRSAYAANTVERALYGTSLGQSLYYLTNRVSYLAGFGFGSSYIAEIWIGFGYIGLFVWNFIIARILYKINNFQFKRFVPSVLILLFLQSLFFMPRAGFDGFVADFASVTHIVAIFVMWVIYKILKSRNSYESLPQQSLKGEN